MQTTKYSFAQGINHEPESNWWVRHNLKNHDRIITLVHKQQTGYLKKTHNIGIELPKTVAKDHALGNNNGNIFLADATSKQTNNVNISFDIMPDGERVPNGHKQIRCHMIFDVKMEDFRRKQRLVADGNMTKTPKCQT